MKIILLLYFNQDLLTNKISYIQVNKYVAFFQTDLFQKDNKITVS